MDRSAQPTMIAGHHSEVHDLVQHLSARARAMSSFQPEDQSQGTRRVGSQDGAGAPRAPPWTAQHASQSRQIVCVGFHRKIKIQNSCKHDGDAEEEGPNARK
ncbi:hypothetical protein MRX96_002603 [Rhipicephalus microplus]